MIQKVCRESEMGHAKNFLPSAAVPVSHQGRSISASCLLLNTHYKQIRSIKLRRDGY